MATHAADSAVGAEAALLMFLGQHTEQHGCVV